MDPICWLQHDVSLLIIHYYGCFYSPSQSCEILHMLSLITRRMIPKQTILDGRKHRYNLLCILGHRASPNYQFEGFTHLMLGWKNTSVRNSMRCGRIFTANLKDGAGLEYEHMSVPCKSSTKVYGFAVCFMR